MTRKSIEKLINGTLSKIAAAHGLNPATEVKGGESGAVNTLFTLAYKRLEAQLIATTNPPAAAPAAAA